MDSMIPVGYTRMLAEEQDEYNNLAIKDVPFEVGEGETVNCMVSCWKPTPEELERLNNGSHITLGIMGTIFPPVIIGVASDESEQESD